MNTKQLLAYSKQILSRLKIAFGIIRNGKYIAEHDNALKSAERYKIDYINATKSFNEVINDLRQESYNNMVKTRYGRIRLPEFPIPDVIVTPCGNDMILPTDKREIIIIKEFDVHSCRRIYRTWGDYHELKKTAARDFAEWLMENKFIECEIVNRSDGDYVVFNGKYIES